MVRTLALALLTALWFLPLVSHADESSPGFTSRLFDGQ